MGIDSIIVWLIVGAIAGWLAGLIVRGGGFGLIGNIVIGIIGAVVAGWLLPQLGINLGVGMLRAIGMTRRQVRRMIRHESVITSLIGAVIGIVLGVLLAALLIARVKEINFVLPGGQLVVFLIAAMLVGIVAAILPARRAARLNVLEALQYE